MDTSQRMGSFLRNRLTLFVLVIGMANVLLQQEAFGFTVYSGSMLYQQTGLQLTKTCDRTQTYSKVGDVIEYTITVTNGTGGTLQNLSLTDSKADNPRLITIPSLAAAARRTFTSSYTITQEDIDRGAVYNEAIITGKYLDQTSYSIRSTDSTPLGSGNPDIPAVDPSCPGCTITPLLQAPKLQVVMSTDRSKRYSKAGETISYSITVKNTGNTTLRQLSLQAAEASNTLLGQAPTLSVNQSLSFSGSYTLTQADIDRGVVYKQSVASATTPKGLALKQSSVDGNPLGSTDPLRSPDCPDCTVSPISREYRLNLVKSIDRSKTYSKIGDELRYTITLTNAGNVTLSDVRVSDSQASLQGNAVFNPMQAGEVQTLTAIWRLTQADIDRGAVYSQASVTAKDPEGNTLSSISVDSSPLPTNDPLYDSGCPNCTVVPVLQSPQLSLTKTTDKSQQLRNVGDKVSYSISVSNNGNVTLQQVTVTDPQADTRVVGTIASLAMGQSQQFIAQHTVTQADLDRGAIYNLATATARTIKGTTVSSTSVDSSPLSPSDPLYDANCAGCTVIATIQLPALTVHKTTDHSRTYNQAGDVVEYNITIKNTGNVSLNNLTVSDPNADQTAVGSILTLAVGEQRTFRAYHTLSQAEMDRGLLYNLALVDGNDPLGRSVTQSSTDPSPFNGSVPSSECPGCTIVQLQQQSRMQLLYVADKAAVYSKVGDVVPFRVEVKNTGNQTLSDIVVRDEQLDSKELGKLSLLAVGQSQQFQGSYTITQADLDRGAVYRRALATASDSRSSKIEQSSVDGNPLGPLDPLLDPACANCTIAPLQQLPKTDFIKTYNRAELYNQIGQVINYSLTISNRGNVTLHNVRVSDPNADTQEIAVLPTLAVGESRSFVAAHSLVQADLTRGAVYNQAKLAATYGSNSYEQFSMDSSPLSSGDALFDPSCPSCTVTPVGYLDRLVLLKTTDRSQVYSKVGDKIAYRLELRKEGNRGANNLVINDPNADNSYVGSVTTLAVGQLQPFSATHTVTQADLDRGAVYNQATVWGRDAEGNLLESLSVDSNPLSSTDEWYDPACPNCTVMPLVQRPSISLLKTADRSRPYKNVGDVIEYWLTVQNTGNVTLFNIQLTDANADDPQIASIARLDVGQTRHFLANHTINQADIDRGAVYNVALAKGVDPRSRPVEATSSDGDPLDPADPAPPTPQPGCPTCTVTPVQQQAAVALSKTTDRSQRYGKVGDVIRYSLLVTNTGNTTLRNLLITDANADVPAVGSIAVLEVGQSAPFSASHTVTQADVDRGVVYNIAYAKGEDPAGRPVENYSTDTNPLDPSLPGTPEPHPDCPACTITPIDQLGSMRVVKTADLGVRYRYAGERIAYTLAITNTGNLTLRQIVVSDPNADTPAVGRIESLAVGETQTLRAYHTITQADMERGYVSNIAAAKGQDPNGDPLEQGSQSGNTPAEGDPTDPACTSCTIAPLPWKNLEALDDHYTGINGKVGVLTASVLVNDKLQGIAVLAAELLLSPGESPTAGIIMQADGRILLPAGIAAGSYSYPYRICEVKNPANCAAAIAHIQVQAARIEALDDAFQVNGKTGGTTASILLNDRLNTQVIIAGHIRLQSAHMQPAASLHIQQDGTVRIAAGTLAGSYALPYQICEVLNPNNCASAVARVEVTMAEIEAIDDHFLPIIGQDGGQTVSVLQNDKLNQQLLQAADVGLTWLDEAPTGLQLLADGSIQVQVKQPAASYTLRYRICELLNPGNCSEATAFLEVQPAPILARDEHIELTWSRESQQSLSVLENDLFNGKAIQPGDVTCTAGTPSDAALSMAADGSIMVGSGLRPGTYTFPYRICEVLNPTNCSQAVATILISSELFIPNVFTPKNRDGVNDTFEIIGHKQFDRIGLVVVNRWGNEVYRNDNYDNDWTGNGLPEATYFYHITAVKGQQTTSLKGWVMIK